MLERGLNEMAQDPTPIPMMPDRTNNGGDPAPWSLGRIRRVVGFWMSFLSAVCHVKERIPI